MTQNANGSDEDGGGRVPEVVLVLAREAALPYLIDKDLGGRGAAFTMTFFIRDHSF